MESSVRTDPRNFSSPLSSVLRETICGGSKLYGEQKYRIRARLVKRPICWQQRRFVLQETLVFLVFLLFPRDALWQADKSMFQSGYGYFDFAFQRETPLNVLREFPSAQLTS